MADDPWEGFLDKSPTKELEQSEPHSGEKDVWAKYIDNAPAIKSIPEDQVKALKIKEGMSKGSFTKWIPGGKFMEEGFLPNMVKGAIPDRFAPNTPEMGNFEKEHPWAAPIARGTGAFAATAPILGKASMMAGPGVMRQFAGQFAASAPMGVAGTVINKGTDTSKEDLAKSVISSGVSSAIPALATGIFGQSARQSYPYSDIGDYLKALKGRQGPVFGSARPYPPNPAAAPGPPPSFTQPQAMLNNTKVQMPGAIASAPPGPPGTWASQTKTTMPGTNIPGGGQALTTALSMGLGGYSHGPLGIALGATAGPGVHKVIEALSHTPIGHLAERLAQHPSTQDIIRALSADAGRKMAPYIALP